MAFDPSRPPRLVATDLDGTIVRDDGLISERTRAALARVEAAGVPLVLVTGRPPRWLSSVVEATGHRGLAVCANGAVVYDLHTEQVVRSSQLEAGTLAEVVDALRAEMPEAAFAVERDAGFLRESAYSHPQADVAVAEVAELVGLPATKLLVRHDTLDADQLLARARVVIGDTATITHSSIGGLIEISVAGVSKATGLAELAEAEGVDAADVLAFGDMPNDLPMLAWAGWSVAVANAHPDVHELVDEVTGGVDEDGVAQVLERLFPA